VTEYNDLLAATRAVTDPATGGAELAAIAQTQPGLRLQVAVHPNAYPGLLAWLGEYGDEVVKRAVAGRSAVSRLIPPLLPPAPQGMPQPSGSWTPLAGPPSPVPPSPPVKKSRRKVVLIISLAVIVVIAGVATTWALLVNRHANTSAGGPDGSVSLTSKPTVTHWDCPKGYGDEVHATVMPDVFVVWCRGGESGQGYLVNTRGKIVWGCPTGEVMEDGTLPTRGASGVMAVVCQEVTTGSDSEYYLYAIDAQDHELWDEPLVSSGWPDVADGGNGTWAVLLGNDLVLVDSTTGGVKSRVQGFREPEYNNSNNSLYMFDGRSLVTWSGYSGDEFHGYTWTGEGDPASAWIHRNDEGAWAGCSGPYSRDEAPVGTLPLSCESQTSDFADNQSVRIDPATGELNHDDRDGLPPFLLDVDVERVLAAAGVAGEGAEVFWVDQSTLIVASHNEDGLYAGVDWPSLKVLWSRTDAGNPRVAGGTLFFEVNDESAFDVYDAKTGHSGRVPALGWDAVTSIGGVVYAVAEYDDSTGGTLTAYRSSDVSKQLWDIELPPGWWYDEMEMAPATAECLAVQVETGVVFLTP
jgi:hypothetical protein